MFVLEGRLDNLKSALLVFLLVLSLQLFQVVLVIVGVASRLFRHDQRVLEFAYLIGGDFFVCSLHVVIA